MLEPIEAAEVSNAAGHVDQRTVAPVSGTLLPHFTGQFDERRELERPAIDELYELATIERLECLHGKYDIPPQTANGRCD